VFSVLGLQTCNLNEGISSTSNEESAEMRIIHGISRVTQALRTRERTKSYTQQLDAHPVRQGGVKCPLVEDPATAAAEIFRNTYLVPNGTMNAFNFQCIPGAPFNSCCLSRNHAGFRSIRRILFCGLHLISVQLRFTPCWEESRHHFSRKAAPQEVDKEFPTMSS
jgi:hypothetical protein